MTPRQYGMRCRGTWAYYRDMGRIRSEYPDADFASLLEPVLARLRQDPDEEEDEEEDDRTKEEEDDDEDDDGGGYSE